jgi:hypothetical protein
MAKEAKEAAGMMMAGAVLTGATDLMRDAGRSGGSVTLPCETPHGSGK